MGELVACFIPCCGSKGEDFTQDRMAGKRVEGLPYDWPGPNLEKTYAELERARAGISGCIGLEPYSAPALYLYKGNFYQVPLKKDPKVKEVAADLMRSGRLRLFIISCWLRPSGRL